MSITKEELSIKTGINSQVIDRLEQEKHPFICRTEEMADFLHFDVCSLFEESDPILHSEFQSSQKTSWLWLLYV
ncbi:hypothetical protein [Butyrivibrio sp. AC2005]|uniref:hypothetical protein n=1 Tax=Butyrivibrio sp. AC2005 TaxID=1280672 RepID=UPI0018C919BD|nr:hypothetical protein [Butyrivibrio sp. AC2005]